MAKGEKKDKKDKKKGDAEIKLQRVYNIPLRKGTAKTPLYRKAKRAIKVMKEFLARHMKADIKDIKIGKYLNLKIWERGMSNIPHHVKVNATKDSDGLVMAELVGAPVEKKPEAKAGKKSEEKPKKEKKEGKDAEAESAIEEMEEELEEKQEKAKEIQKEELKTIKKEPVDEKMISSSANTDKPKEHTVTRKVFAEAKRQRP